MGSAFPILQDLDVLSVFPRVTADENEVSSSGSVTYPSGTPAQSIPSCAELCPLSLQCGGDPRSPWAYPSTVSHSVYPPPGRFQLPGLSTTSTCCRLHICLAWTSVFNFRPVCAIVDCVLPLGCSRGSTVHKHHCPTSLLHTPSPPPTWHPQLPRPTS